MRLLQDKPKLLATFNEFLILTSSYNSSYHHLFIASMCKRRTNVNKCRTTVGRMNANVVRRSCDLHFLSQNTCKIVVRLSKIFVRLNATYLRLSFWIKFAQFFATTQDIRENFLLTYYEHLRTLGTFGESAIRREILLRFKIYRRPLCDIKNSGEYQRQLH